MALTRRNAGLSLVARAIAILRKYGTDAHVYLPGIGTVSGLTAGNYLDSAGTTSASVDNPVGLSLDALQAMTLGAELWGTAGVTIGGGWASNGLGGYTHTPGTSNTVYSTIGITAGNLYFNSVTVSGRSAGGVQLLVGNSGAGPTFSANGSFTADVYGAGNGTYYLQPTSDFDGTITVNSVKKIPGIHATQATTANKPILRRGLLNRFLQCQVPNSAAWITANLNVTLGQASSPYGTSDSALLAPTAVSGSHVLYQNNVTISRNVTMAFIAKAGVLQFLSPSNAGVEVLTSTFDLVSGTSVNGASTTSSMVSLGGGWWLGAMSFTAAYTAASFYINNSSSVSIAYFAGNGTDGLYMYRAGLFDGTYTAQQIIDAGGIPVTTTAAASNPNAGRYSWQFDGSNDSLSLSAPLFQMSDDHCVIAGAKVDSVAAQNTIFAEIGTGRIQFRYNTGAMQFLWLGASVGTNYVTTPTYLNQAIVVSGRNVSGTKTSRVNAVTLNTDATVPDTPSMSSASIGSLGGSSNYMSGSIYPVIAIKGTISDADLLAIERLVGQLSGVSI